MCFKREKERKKGAKVASEFLFLFAQKNKKQKNSYKKTTIKTTNA